MSPRIILAGGIDFAKEESKELFNGVAELVPSQSSNQTGLLAELKTGKFDGAVGMYCRGPVIATIDRGLLEALPSTVKWLAQCGAGYDNADVVVLKEKGISLSNTPGSVTSATATTALYLLLSTVRRFSQCERSLYAGQWRPLELVPVSHEPNPNMTLAIFGMGEIGLRLAEYARVFPMRVVYYARNPHPEADWCEYFGPDRLDEMLAQTDVLSVHVPLSPATVGIIGEKEIRSLKKGSIIINTARGKVIDEAALIRALEDGHLSTVGLDVFPEEPKVNPRLLEFPQVCLLPHIGGMSVESLHLMEKRALTNLRDFVLEGKGKDLIPELR